MQEAPIGGMELLVSREAGEAVRVGDGLDAEDGEGWWQALTGGFSSPKSCANRDLRSGNRYDTFLITVPFPIEGCFSWHIGLRRQTIRCATFFEGRPCYS